ncbi:MAG: alpha/beta fold hydrolase [Solirubrobacterales bacterium]
MRRVASSRWFKVTVGVLAGLVLLLLLNAVTVSNETKQAEVNADGGELVETSYGSLQVVDEGDPGGTPIVLIHGYAGSVTWWEKLPPLLSEQHRVIRIDLLGHGGSEKPGAGYAIENQSSAIAEALASLGVQGATVVGHSLGGTVAVAVAERSPQVVAKVVIVDQAPDDSFEEDAPLVQEASYVPVIGQALARLTDWVPASVVRDSFEDAFAPGFNIASGFDNPDQVVDDLREMTYTAFEDTVDAESDYSEDQPLDQRMAAINLPLLVIFGSEDQFYEAEASTAPYRKVEGAQVAVLEGVGHSPNVERPDQLAPLILDFVAGRPVKLPAGREKGRGKKGGGAQAQDGAGGAKGGGKPADQPGG